jgi:hypothetical protein
MSTGSRCHTTSASSRGIPKRASATARQIAPTVSASPPREMALRIASSKPFGAGRRPSAFHPLGMVVRDPGDGVRQVQRLGERVGEKARRRNAHRRAVAKAAVRRSVAGKQPPGEPPAPSRIGISPLPVFEGADRSTCMQQSVGHSDGQRRVVSEAGSGMNEGLEILALRRPELVDGTDDVTGDGTEHAVAPLLLPKKAKGNGRGDWT